MSKFDLRDISQRLSGSKDADAVVFEFLGYLQAMKSDWRATLAFYEVSRDALVSIYERQGNRLTRRDVTMAVDRLPARLVRKFFHPVHSSMPPTAGRCSRRCSELAVLRADPTEAPSLTALTPIQDWQSCVCMPLADQEDLLAMLVVVSPRRAPSAAASWAISSR